MGMWLTPERNLIMAKDYKNTKSVRHQSARQIPGWLWLSTGLLIGLFVAFLIYLQTYVKSDAKAATVPHEKATNPLGSAKAVEEKSMAEGINDHSSFEFYQVLKHDRVVVPNEEPKVQRPVQKTIHPPPRVIEKSTKHQVFILQAGSFRRYIDADQRKATLALLGIKSIIQKVVIKDNQTWHRVRVGPYDDVAQINEMRALLHSKKIDTLLMRI